MEDAPRSKARQKAGFALIYTPNLQQKQGTCGRFDAIFNGARAVQVFRREHED